MAWHAPPPSLDRNKERPARSYPFHKELFASANGEVAAGLLFDTRHYTLLSINHPPNSQTPDISCDKEGDRVLVILAGDLALQIGTGRFRLRMGDAVRIPRGTYFGRTQSDNGAHLLLIRSKGLRSFTMYT
jgi:uncharacterized cupin superfamily protein